MSDDEKRFVSTIYEFQNLVKKYKLKSKLPELSIITGISQKQLKTILDTYCAPDCDEEIQSDIAKKYLHLKDNVESFVTTFDPYGSFIRMPDIDFINLLDELKDEFPEMTYDRIIEKSTKSLSDQYNLAEKSAVLRQQDALSEQYGSKAETASYISDYIEMLERESNALSAELVNCCNELDFGISLPTGEYDEEDNPIEEIITLSEEERERHEKEAEQLKSQISIIRDIINEYRTVCGEENVQAAQELQRKIDTKIRKAKLPFSILREKNIDSFNCKQFQLDRLHLLSAHQQRSIFQDFYQLCFDEKGFVLPKHLKTGINLAKLNVTSDDTLLKHLKANNACQLPEKYMDSDVFLLIYNHKNVLFHDTSTTDTPFCTKTHLSRVMVEILHAPREIQSKTLYFLKDNFHVAKPDSPQARLYNKTISEYLDLLSMELPVKGYEQYGFEQIYCIAYRICEESKGEYVFSYRLVRDILLATRSKSPYWLYMMYIYSYYHKHRETDSIIEYIEEEKQNSKDIDL